MNVNMKHILTFSVLAFGVPSISIYIKTFNFGVIVISFKSVSVILFKLVSDKITHMCTALKSS